MAIMPVDWGLFKITVEGRESSVSCTIRDGLPYFSPHSIQQESPPQLHLLRDLLGSDAGIPNDIKGWLAELMDPTGTSDFHFILKRRLQGKPKRAMTAHWNAVMYYEDLIDESMQVKKAIGLTCEKFGISESTFRTAKASLEDAREVNERVSMEEMNINTD